MIKQLSVFTSEVTRVAREVGTDGKLGGQAQVPEVSGVWKDLTESVNLMASNLTAQVRNISDVTIAVASGGHGKGANFLVRLPRSTMLETPLPFPVSPVGPSQNVSAKRVVLIDDNEDGATLLAEALRRFRAEGRMPVPDAAWRSTLSARSRQCVAILVCMRCMK